MCRRELLVIGGGDRKIGGQSPIPEQSMLGQEIELSSGLRLTPLLLCVGLDSGFRVAIGHPCLA